MILTTIVCGGNLLLALEISRALVFLRGCQPDFSSYVNLIF